MSQYEVEQSGPQVPNIDIAPVSRWAGWAVAQNLGAFGYCIEKTRPTRFLAALAASSSPYLTVLPTAEALAYNQRTQEPGFVLGKLGIDLDADMSPMRTPGAPEQ